MIDINAYCCHRTFQSVGIICRVTLQQSGVFFLLFPFFPLLMPRLNGNSLGCVLGGCAEHAVVMIDKKRMGSQRETWHSHHSPFSNELLESRKIKLHRHHHFSTCLHFLSEPIGTYKERVFSSVSSLKKQKTVSSHQRQVFNHHS